MKCPDCGGGLKVIRTYPAEGACFQDRKCKACSNVVAVVLRFAPKGMSAHRLSIQEKRKAAKS